MAKTPRAITDMSTLSRVIFDPDTTPPSIPTNVIGTPVSSTRIDLTWGASSDTGGSGMSGYLIYRNGAQVGSTNTTTFSDTGLVSSTAYLYQLSAVDGAGNVSSLSTTIAVTTQANVGPPVYAQDQPKAALIGISGVRTFSDPTQQAFIGRFNWAVLGIAGWELWANSGRDADVSCKAVKAASTAPGGTLLGPYQNLNAIEEDANDPFPTYTAEIAARNWRLYVTNTTTLVTPNSSSTATALVNYTDFVSVNPSLEHPYEFGAAYVYNKFLTKSKSDARFTGLAAGLASSSFDFVFMDNFLCNPQVNGDWNRDGTTEGQGWPCTATPWLQAGQKRYVNRIRSLAPTKYVVINGGDYGVVTDAGPMAGQADSILAESYMGKYWSWETQRGFVTMLQYYYRVLATAANPELVIFGGSWPDTASDGSALPRLPTPSGYPPAYTQEQWARYIAGTAYLGEGMAAISQVSKGYSSDLADLYWPWFWGGVNGLARSWLGKPIDALRPTTPKISKGTIGIYGVERTNAIHLVNPRGNGAQVINASDIPGSWQYPAGSPQGTGAFSSYTLAENDALFLQRSMGTPTFFQNFDALPVGSTIALDNWGACQVDNTQKFSGSNSYKYHAVSGSGAFGASKVLGAATSMPTQGDEVWFRQRLLFQPGFDFTATPAMKFMRIDTGSVANQGHGSHIDFYLINGGPVAVPVLDYILEGVAQWMFGGPGNSTGPSSGIVRGVWRTFEVYYKLHSVSSSAIIRMWQDGNLVIDTSANLPTGVPRRATLNSATDVIGNAQFGNPAGFMSFTYWNTHSPATQDAWCDDFTVYCSNINGKPTAKDAAGNLFIGMS